MMPDQDLFTTSLTQVISVFAEAMIQLGQFVFRLYDFVNIFN